MLNIEDFRNHLPSDWGEVNFNNEYELEDISSDSSLYSRLLEKVWSGYMGAVGKIVRVKNPCVYLQYSLHKEMYEKNGGRVVELYHDTAEDNVYSIARSNLDYRFVSRSKFGRGVSFSPSPLYANKYSSKKNGICRAMFIADVLLHREHSGSYSTKIPESGYDGTYGNGYKVHVKYFDNEFYPKYVVYYRSSN